MRLKLIDRISIGSGHANEDRVGLTDGMAWVIDGATDVLDAPLVGGHPSDASWFADELHAEFERIAADGSVSLAGLPMLAAERIAPRFERARSRAPRARHELPSAAGLIVRLDHGTSTSSEGSAGSEGSASYLALADCSLVVDDGGTVTRYGADLLDLGDRRHREIIAQHRDKRPADATSDLRISMRDYLQAARDYLNTPGGYGAFSVVAPRPEHTVSGRFGVRPGTRLMLASDGFMRLADMFEVYTTEALMHAALAHGVAPLVDELRRLERGDASGSDHPRFKTSDDASAMLVEVVG